MNDLSVGAGLDNLCVNTIRFLSVDAIEEAKSGHPGLPLGAAPMAYVLWTKYLKHNPANPKWFDRDRFVLSAGHGSMLLYSLLHLTGYDLSLGEIRKFRQWGSMTPGHPERGLTAGVETTTGPLGQGFGNGVGMAVAEAHLAAKYNRPGCEIVNHFTYGIVSDGDLMEGVASEAASLAGHLKLGKLIYLYDDNRVSLGSSTALEFTEDRARRFQAYGWHTLTVPDGNDLAAIDRALREAREETERPSLILVRTHLGYGSPNKQDTFEAHGSPLGDQETRLTKERLGWPTEPRFHIPREVSERFRDAIRCGGDQERAWSVRLTRFQELFPDDAREFLRVINGELPPGWDESLPEFKPDAKGISTRAASGKILNGLARNLPTLIGGSADLNPSTFTVLEGFGNFESPRLNPDDTQGAASGPSSYAGKNLFFGVREHGMGSVLNGMAAHGGIVPYGATFLVFSDYMRPSIRLAALMGIQVIFIFTHDSIALGQDGPTHQPVEHLASLRAVPRLIVLRPCDAGETVEAWRVAIARRDGPTALILTRQNVPTLDRSRLGPAEGLRQGAYILAREASSPPAVILISTGSEVSLALEAAARLQEKKISVRVVSMPSWELFQEQPGEYRETVFPRAVTARLAVEAGSPMGWDRYVGMEGGVIGIDRFGASAPGETLLKEFGFTVENIVAKALKLVQKGA